MAGRLLAEGNVEKAISICRKGLEVYPHYEEAKLILGEAYLTQGMVAEAKGNLEEVLELDQQNLRALQGLMEIAQREEDIDRAIQLSELILQIDPSNRKATSFLRKYESGQAPGPKEPSTERKPVIEPPEAPSLKPSEEEAKAPVEAEGEATIEPPQVEEPEEEIPPKGKAPSESPLQPEVTEETEVEREEATAEEVEVPLKTSPEKSAEKQPTTESQETPFIEEPEGVPRTEEKPSETTFEEVEETGKEGLTTQPAESPPMEELPGDKRAKPRTEKEESTLAGAEIPPLKETLPPEEEKKKPSGTEEEPSLGMEEGIKRLESEFAGIETPTLAEIYRKQGLWEKSLEVYTRLLESDPENEDYKAKIEEIKKELNEAKDES